MHKRSWSDRALAGSGRKMDWRRQSVATECGLSPKLGYLPPSTRPGLGFLRSRTLHKVLNLILIIVCGSLVVALLIKDLKFSKYVAKSVRSNASRANKMLHQLAEDRSWSAYYAPPALIDATTDQVQVIYAVVTVAEKAEMRNAIRTSYRQMISADPVKYHNDIVKVVFVVGKPDHDGFSAHHELLKYESALYEDVVVLDTTENMNDGKTFETFRAIHDRDYFGIDAQFVYKIDDDTVMNLPATVDHLRDHLRAHNDTAVPSIYLGMELRFDSAFDGDLGKGAPCGTHYAGRPVPATYASGSAYALGRKEVEWLASEAGMKHWQDNFSGWKCKHEDVNMGLLLSLNPEPTYLQHEWRLWWRYPAWEDEREWPDVFCWHWAKTLEAWIKVARHFVAQATPTTQSRTVKLSRPL